MSDDRSEHVVTIGGVEHTMLLTAEDAKRLNATPAKAATAPNKARSTAQTK